jgi:lipopolysaccharide/colanic/teichoic acid biosynthesis glycosyltransferase
MRLTDVDSPKVESLHPRSEPGPIPRWKRILDGICICVSLPLTLPVFLAIALWVKIASPGPILFRQKRVGLGGQQFLMFKFRTMKENVETVLHEKHVQGLMQADVPMTKLDTLSDPRIIPGGRILRALGLDELPQLLNVARREMSLVGPRPCLPCEWERLAEWQRERYNAAPGLTGYWQVNGKNKTTFTQMIEMDIWYTKNLSLSVDIEIMFKTVPAILSQVSRGKKEKRVAPVAKEEEIDSYIITTPQEGDI